ncbi:MAG: prepilin-type N-terminal cleavage/methylation domain-containing protein [Gammaproteobacteria bacterium]|nr:prepilin-type N-terminal cleavage/methylation domain-containing protein [Gammaproteobacteria bacterium]
MCKSIKYTASKISNGFTLVEVLIVIAILGILAMFIIPSYSEQVQKTRRSDAKISLMQTAQILERCFSDNSSYAAGAGCTDFTAGVLSDEQFYTITATTQTATTYTLTATPNSTQANDTQCATFTLDQTGAKSAANSSNVAQTNCW